MRLHPDAVLLHSDCCCIGRSIGHAGTFRIKLSLDNAFEPGSTVLATVVTLAHPIPILWRGHLVCGSVQEG